jgi:membrane associated rhomboid family serine protease
VRFLVILVVVAATVAYRVTSAEERKRFCAAALDRFRQLRKAAAMPRPENDAFRAALRARMRFALVTLALGAVVTFVFVRMKLDAGSISPDTLVAWGAGLGTRTTNGEWWRLVTAAFVHDGWFHFLVDLAALIQIGLILERLVGRLTIAAVYLSAGVFDGLVNLSSRPLAVTVSASSAVFGLYGVLLAALLWQTFHLWRMRPAAGAVQEATAEDALAGDGIPDPPEHTVGPDLIIPPVAMRRLAVVGTVFVLYSAFSGRAHDAQCTGLLVGMMYGVVFARRAGEKAPRPAWVGGAVFATACLSAAGVIGIGTITDVKPEIARVRDLEHRTAAEYQTELDALKKGRTTPEALARLAEGNIVAELQAADERLKSLTQVPAEHRHAVADAREYVRLRCASWRARAEAIRHAYAEPPRKPDGADDTAWRLHLQDRFRSDTAVRARAEVAERASLDAFQRITRLD